MTGPEQLPAPEPLAGVTANGLRYPAGTDPVYDIPAYLQNLAADIDAKVQKASGNATVVFAAWTGNLTFARNPVYQTVALPTIRILRGAVFSRHAWSGGRTDSTLLYVYPSWERPGTDQAYWNKIYIGASDPKLNIDAGGGQYYADYFIGTAGVTFLAWGDPNPVGG